MAAGLPPALVETLFNVKSDCYHIGDACVKKGVTKGICDLCYYLLGANTPETLEHILCTCLTTTAGHPKKMGP